MKCLASSVTPCSGRQENRYCSKHYQQVRRYGRVKPSTRDPRPAVIEGRVAKIPLRSNGKDEYALVDAQFAYLAEHKWTRTHYGYVRRNIDKVLMHRLLLDAESKQVVDHINGDKLDNRLSNIRLCRQADNSKNQKTRRNNTSGYKGVYFDKRLKKFVARVKCDYKTYFAGSYTNAQQAAEAYNKLAKQLHGEYARVNDGV